MEEPHYGRYEHGHRYLCRLGKWHVVTPKSCALHIGRVTPSVFQTKVLVLMQAKCLLRHAGCPGAGRSSRCSRSNEDGSLVLPGFLTCLFFQPDSRRLAPTAHSAHGTEESATPPRRTQKKAAKRPWLKPPVAWHWSELPSDFTGYLCARASKHQSQKPSWP